MENGLADISIDALLAFPTLDEKQVYLGEHGWLSEQGFSELIQISSAKMQANVGEAGQICEIVKGLAPSENQVLLGAHATYLLAQTEVIQGDLEDALVHVDSAEGQFFDSGDVYGGLRTTLGRVRILGNLGRLQEAIDSGQAALATLADQSGDTFEGLAGLIAMNVGICFKHLGLYEDSLAMYESAAQAAHLFLPMERDFLLTNRGIALTMMGEYAQARADAETELRAEDKASHPYWYARRLVNLGDLYRQTGEYASALSSLEEARDIYEAEESTDATHFDSLIAWLDSSEIWKTLNLLPEAMLGFEKAKDGFEAKNTPYELARSWHGIGSVHAAMGELDSAETALRKSYDLFVTLGNTHQQAVLLTEIASIELLTSRSTDALGSAEQAVLLAPAENLPITHFYARLRLGDIHLANGDHDSAEEQMQLAQAALDGNELPQLRQSLYGRWGKLRLRQDKLISAEHYLQLAIEAIETMRQTLLQETTRTSFLRDKVTVYADLISLYLDRNSPGDIEKAFTIAEQAKARTLVDLMMSNVDNRLEDGQNQGSEEKLQTLRSNLHGLYDTLLNDNADERGIRHRIFLQATEIEREILHIQLRDQRTLVANPVLPLTDLQTLLPPDLPILIYHINDDEILAFIIHNERVKIVRHLADLDAVTNLITKLQSRWERIRISQAVSETANVSPHEKSAQRILNQLYEAVFAPLQHHFTDPSLVIAPHGILHLIPFHALHDGTNYLIDTFEFSYTPSVSTFALCQSQQRKALNNALLVGVSDTSLQYVPHEIKAVENYFETATVLMEASATRTALNDQLSQNTDLLHIASHGMFRADNPVFSSFKLHDGWITTHDIMRLKQAPPFVTLSACESGRSKFQPTDEPIGLIRAFFSIGALSLLTNLWLVRDEVSAEFMPHFYQLLQEEKMPPSTALRHTQLKIKAKYPHPWHWASFQIVGKR